MLNESLMFLQKIDDLKHQKYEGDEETNQNMENILDDLKKNISNQEDYEELIRKQGGQPDQSWSTPQFVNQSSADY